MLIRTRIKIRLIIPIRIFKIKFRRKLWIYRQAILLKV